MFRIEYYTSIQEVPVSDWNCLVTHNAVGLETSHLRAIENSRINNIHPFYLIGYQGDNPIGIAYCFSIQINLAKMANSYPPEVFETIKTWKPDFMELRLIEAGHIASIGTTVEINPSFQTEFLRAFSTKIDEIAKLENADLCLVRDVSSQQYAGLKTLEDTGFIPVMGFPIARMALHWENFDGYLASLKAKKRKNTIEKQVCLQAPEISVEIIEDYAPYAERLSELWTNVAQNNNGYEHERLTPEYFKAMSFHLKGRSHVVAIKRYNEIIAYGLNLIGDEEYFGMAEGMDYAFRDKYELYANNIYEALRVACKLKKKTFNIGITTYDFKNSIGAEIEPAIYFLKALKHSDYSAAYADLIRKGIKQPLNHHRAFKNTNISGRLQLKDLETSIYASNNNLDPFDKLLKYTRIDTARAAGLYNYCPIFESAQEPVITHNGNDVIMLGTNAYLGLATHPKVVEASLQAIKKYGSGCSGSPMLNGTLDLHYELERELANFIHKQDALIFSTGYQTNVGTISALINRNDVLIMDERNHASLVDGAVVSRATLARYKHNNMESLEEVLKKYVDKPKLVVTDSLFSMEGTIVNLPRIVQLAKQYHARLMLDESHAIGVIGSNGRGVAEHFNLTDSVDVIMGTFSKSLASVGGFVAGDKKIVDTLKHTSRAHIFSASLPPSAVAAVLAAIKIINNEPERRIQLLRNASFLANGLQNLGYKTDYQDSAIVSIFCGHEMIAVAAFQKLLEEGVFVNPVTSPAVPKGHEILRISLMATHNEDMLQKALEIFKRIKTKYWPQECYGDINKIP
jgi:8-amino-7-oxononanoate synthase